MPPAPSATRPLAAVLLLTASLVPTACLGAGASAITDGRALYNDVITRTGDEQVLNMIVRHRYDETFGMLDVASVTSQVQVEANGAINVGAGDEDSYDGNLVPFAAGVSYSESPTISYVPMSGEEFMSRLVAPVSLAQALTLAQMNRVPGQAFELMVRRINGLTNAPGHDGTPSSFQRVSKLLADFDARGQGDVVVNGENYFVSLHDYGGTQDDEVKELLDLLQLTGFTPDGRELLIPIRLTLGIPPKGDEILLETKSVLDLVRLAGDSIDIPAEHIEAGYVVPAAQHTPDFIRFRSARERPADATVAVFHRGWWFFVDATDIPSKRAFVLLRAVISMGIESQASEKSAPVLSLDVGG